MSHLKIFCGYYPIVRTNISQAPRTVSGDPSREEGRPTVTADVAAQREGLRRERRQAGVRESLAPPYSLYTAD